MIVVIYNAKHLSRQMGESWLNDKLSVSIDIFDEGIDDTAIISDSPIYEYIRIYSFCLRLSRVTIYAAKLAYFLEFKLSKTVEQFSYDT